jgi:hypothetical protein|uniref:Uncharacterized protein n=1 Tax=uncultured bacterium contig00106 TaxID=1181572 RepID=A0A806KSR4_9BACT|nr:hypothetical protein [uncultured bacterium contig00106]
MSSEHSFSIEFPADRDYVPYIQDFFKSFLKNFDFSNEFAERAYAEALSWFNSVIEEEKFLHALPTISFCVKTQENVVSVQIKTSDKKEFITSLNAQEQGEAK